MDGIVHIYKARLVAKGYTQLYGVNYEETFSPVAADIRAIRILISIAAYYDYEIWQMDVKTAFLNGYLDEDIYMVQPEGFVDPNHPRKVCKLQRSIYGLKQASRSWNKRFDEEIKRYVLGLSGKPSTELELNAIACWYARLIEMTLKSQQICFRFEWRRMDWRAPNQSTTTMSAQNLNT
ncbi:retrotransposon protein, putative, ty1-copia subclass [Tanacetum coccineum]